MYITMYKVARKGSNTPDWAKGCQMCCKGAVMHRWLSNGYTKHLYSNALPKIGELINECQNGLK